MPGEVHVIEHPLVQHKLSLMRMKSTSTSAFRNLLSELSLLWPTRSRVTCPRTGVHRHAADAHDRALLDGKKIVLISIMRAGRAFSTACCACCRARGSATWASTATPGAGTGGVLLQGAEGHGRPRRHRRRPDARHRQLRGGRGRSPRGRTRARSSSCACSRAPRGSPRSTITTPTCRCTRRRSTAT